MPDDKLVKVRRNYRRGAHRAVTTRQQYEIREQCNYPQACARCEHHSVVSASRLQGALTK
jgi:hypothetical protein